MALDLNAISAGQNFLAKQPTPADKLAQFANTQSTLQNNQITQQNFLAQKAVGQAIQNATGPDGQIDTAAAASAIAANPMAAPAATAAAQKLYDLKVAGLGITKAQAAVVQQHTDMFARALEPIVAQSDKSGQPISADDIMTAGAGLLNNGAFGDPKSDAAKTQLTQLMSTMPATPAGIDAWGRNHALDSANMSGGLDRFITGQSGSINDGTTVQPTNTNLNTGATRPAGPGFAIGPTNAALAAPTPIGNNPDGSVKYAPQSAVNTGGGAPNGGAGGYQGTPPPGQVDPTGKGPGGFNFGNGSYGGNAPAGPQPGAAPAPAAQAPSPQAAPPTPQPAAGPAPGGAWPNMMAPGQQQAVAAKDTSAAGQYADDQANAGQYAPRITAANHALSLLQDLGPTGTGVGTGGLNTVKSWLGQAFGNSDTLASVSNFDEASKYLSAMATGSPGAGHSNEALNAAFASNPSTHISNAASVDVLKTNISLMRQQQASVLAYQNGPGQTDQGGAGYPAFKANFATSTDPRAFGFDLMTPAQRTRVVSGMTTNQKAAFYADVNTAIKAGVMQAPGAASGQ